MEEEGEQEIPGNTVISALAFSHREVLSSFSLLLLLNPVLIKSFALPH